jgi:ABC-type phosphate/phosphonate transport system substrate-binding protein
LVNPRGGGALQRGLAFVSARSPLFAEPDAGPTRVAEILQSTPLGVPASQSLAGFTAPMLQLAERHGVTRHDGGLVWYPSSADVTKAVLAGLVDAGVCEAGIHEMVLRGAGIEQEAPRLRRILFQTNPLPVDPVLVRPTLDPEVSELGRELKRALRTLSFSQDFGELSLQSARDEDYAAVPEMLDRFARVLGTLRP